MTANAQAPQGACGRRLATARGYTTTHTRTTPAHAHVTAVPEPQFSPATTGAHQALGRRLRRLRRLRRQEALLEGGLQPATSPRELAEAVRRIAGGAADFD